jgi:C_GCAxxG_C_C family probable redox protein
LFAFFISRILHLGLDIYMTISSKKALDLFLSGYNCAQSVLLAYADVSGHERRTLEAISLCFGGGMGKMQKTCGAVTGAFMAIGLHVTETVEDREAWPEYSRRMVQEFHSRFLLEHRSSECIEIIGYDITTPEAQDTARQHERKENICSPCVANAVKILNKLFDLEV